MGVSDAFPEIGKTNSLPAAGAKLEAALAGLEGLSKEELARVGERVKEMMGKYRGKREGGGAGNPLPYPRWFV